MPLSRTSAATPAPAAEAGAEADKRRAADQAYDSLETLIVTLQLPPGAPIVEAELAERTGLGRTPTREALMRMVANGLIEQLPRRGLRVSEIRLAEQLDLVEARRALERLIAASAARRAAPEQRLAMLGHAQAMAEAAGRDALDDYMAADQALDHVIHAACRNPFAVTAVVPMVIQCRRFWVAHQHQGDMREGARLHLLLAQALAEGEGEAAVAAADALMDYLRRFAQEVIE